MTALYAAWTRNEKTPAILLMCDRVYFGIFWLCTCSMDCFLDGDYVRHIYYSLSCQWGCKTFLGLVQLSRIYCFTLFVSVDFDKRLKSSIYLQF